MHELADKLKTASELLMSKQHIVGLWLNASVSNALKVVDSEYQRLTRPPESVATAGADLAIAQDVVPVLKTARGWVQAWIRDRDRTKEMLASLEDTGCPPGNDSLEVAEILGGLGPTPTISTDW